jgi:apolipoprotein N-acyltransferase
MLSSIALLSLAFAPVNQFYLAWLGLAPWLLVILSTPSKKSAFAWGFGSAWVFFLVNMWWLWFVTPPGLFALTLYLAIFSGLAAVAVRLLFPPLPPGEGTRARALAAILIIPALWVAFEWLRGNISFLGKQGLPWLFLGQTQSPLLVMCQIADVTSVLGVSFWVVMVNVLVAMLILHRRHIRQLVPATALVVLVLIAIGAYGALRLAQDTLSPGPTVMVVQSNYKQSNTGEKGAPTSQIVRFHVATTRDALRQVQQQQRGQTVDLVVWSETMMPPLNRTARNAARGTRQGELWQQTYEVLAELANEFRTPLLVGGIYLAEWTERDEGFVALDRRNAAFFIDATGTLGDERYDKVHLVPFGEYIPFKETIPPLYRLFIKLGPNYYEEYALTRGSAFTVFPLERVSGPDGRPVRFVVPICFEDIVPSLVARMLYDPQGGGKRADFLVNITNDGWFRANQMPQHLQAAIFRSIENRVPTARSVNTGISAFVDPLGRVSNIVPAETEGWSVATLQLDRRVAPYTRIGDAFPITCIAVTAVAVGVAIIRSRKVRPPAQVE